MTVEQWLKYAKQQLTTAGSSSPAIDAEVLLLSVLDKPRSYLFTWPDKALTATQSDQLQVFLSRRLSGEPVAYITGVREFWSLPLQVAPSTLIPRPDTERLVELALQKLPSSGGDVLDLGTGTGAVALALASERPDCQLTGIDLQPEAVSLAKSNATALSIENATFLQGSWYSPLQDGTKFAVIVSNPPYIDPDDEHLTQGDVRFEPLSALIADKQGMADIEWIAEQGRCHLSDGGWLMFEHGYDQGPLARDCLTALGYCDVVTEQDYAGHDRVTMGCWKGL
ncbi:peptide chain release factor N(5)-glutamine methyltransferase [Thaumasiovibrio subtropicus]|uniref:peptide chain release factor N(5)-glutamine methyltransferase n=1 Tax=Thaumasiovibrio subtropicus TaxID=1891207 RepID=UPI000B35F9BD|nr:peptide chain release factor N(5)-glutamine methyltransferase [Thaumasiovibrio subtropicus]